MRRLCLVLVGLLLLAIVPQCVAQRADSRFVVAQPLFDAVATEYSGEKAFENVRGIVQFHRVQATPGYSQAGAWIVEQLRSYGIADVEVEKFPSDGRTRYSTYVSPMSWTVREGELWVEEPFRERLCRYTDQPMCLSTLSNGGEWRGGTIDVGGGADAASYEGKDVRGKIVFASGYAGAVHREAVIKRGALGVVIYPSSYDRPEQHDLIRYYGLWIQGDEVAKSTFGFQISARQWARLKPLVESGKLVLRAKVDAELHPGNLEVPTALLRGESAQEIILVAHLCHPKWSANDNASGSAAILEAARTVKALLDQKKIPPLKRTIRFMWVPEHFGTVAWLTKHPEVAGTAIAALNLDMVGENIYKTNSRMYITRTPDSLPSFVNDLVENVAEQVEAANLVSPNGSRNLFHWRMTPYGPGSDHDVFNDGNVRVPSLMIGHGPDWTHHSNEDSLDKVDSTELRRAGVLATTVAVWLATSGDEEALKLAGYTMTSSYTKIFSTQRDTLFLLPSVLRGPEKPEEVPAEESERGMKRATLATLAMGIYAEQGQRALKALEALLSERGRDALGVLSARFEMMRTMGVAVTKAIGFEEPPATMKRIPKKNFIGPIADGPSSLWFRQAMGAEYAWWQEQSRKVPRFGLIVYEACNFADAKRTLAEIEDAVAVEYGGLPAGLIEGVFDRLAKIGLVEWAETKK